MTAAHPRSKLARLLDMAGAHDAPEFDCPARAVWTYLYQAGARFHFNPLPHMQALLLQWHGARVVETEHPPKPGDIYCVAEGGLVMHLGLVVKVNPHEPWFLGRDHRGGRPQRVSVAEVAYWLRFG